MHKILQYITPILVLIFLGGMSSIESQNLIRSDAPTLYLAELKTITSGKVMGYLSNRWDHTWRTESGFGGSTLNSTAWGEKRLRKSRLKFFPALEGKGSLNGDDVNRSGTVLDLAPIVTIVARYHLPPTGKYSILLWSRFEKHSVVTERSSYPFGYDFSPRQEPGRTSFQSRDFTWAEYDIGDGGVVLFYPGGTITTAKSNPIWGPGYTGQLLFSKKAPSFTHISFQHNFSEQWQFSAFHGWLNSGLDDSSYIAYYGPYGGLPKVRKYIAAHRFDVWLKQNFRVGFGESVIYGSRGVEPAYLIPFIFTWSSQHDLGDSDNLQMFLDFDWIVKQIARIYGAFYFDEWDFVDTFTDSSRNWTAWQTGVTLRLPVIKTWLPLFRFEYTRLSPYVYVHRSQVNSRDHHGHWLGYWSGPNSDCFFTGIDIMPRENWWLQLFYQVARRGEVNEETIATQYNHKKVKFLYKTYPGDVERRQVLGLKASGVLNSWLRMEFVLSNDDWIQHHDQNSNDRVSDQKVDIIVKLIIGL
ncbi:MAG: hypothetical protein ACE5EE_02915 [Fidelibacterota bacterium]